MRIATRKTWARDVVRRVTGPLRETSFAMAVLIALSAAIALGAFLPQESLVAGAEIQARFGAAYPLMRALGLFSLYGAPWFLLLEGLLFACLATGSFQWLRPAWLAATRPQFKSAAQLAQESDARPWDATSAGAPPSPEALVRALTRQGYRVATRSQDGAIYGARLAWARLGPVLAHLGVMTLLAASTYGAFSGFSAQKTLAPGASFWLPTQADAFIPTMPAPFWRGAAPPATIRLERFDVDYQKSPDGDLSPRQYRSLLTVSDARGRLRARGESSVNSPLRVDGLSIYQSGYAPTGRVTLIVNGRKREIALNQRLMGRPAGFVAAPESTPAALLVVFPALKSDSPQAPLQPDPSQLQALALDAEGVLLNERPASLTAGSRARVGPLDVRYEGPQWSSALLIRHAPETPWAFAAFAMIALGSLACLLTQRQYWAAWSEDGRLWTLLLPHRRLAGFERERRALAQAVSTSFPAPDEAP